MSTLKETINARALEVEANLTFLMPPFSGREQILYDSARYSLLAGGKRLRPILFLEFARIFGVDKETAMPYACALEMIHTYSLIHDDLPCMDNDEYRRGMKTNHMVYGEAIALLAGDALLNRAYEVMLRASANKGKNAVDAMYCIASNSGMEGMIGGQVIDLISEGLDIDSQTLVDMYNKKTCGLLRAACEGGALLGGADEVSLTYIRRFATELGIAFQIRDDILDVEGDAKLLGKPIGSDSANSKSTAVYIFGMEKAKQLANVHTNNALSLLETIPDNEFLTELTKYLLTREN